MPAKKHLWRIMQKALLMMNSAFCMVKGTALQETDT